MATTEERTATAEDPKPIIVTAKRDFPGVSLRDAMRLLGQSDFLAWRIDAPPRPPSPFLTEALTRFDAFDLTNSEAAKVLLIDALLIKVVPAYPNLRVWKAAPLESDALLGSRII